VAALWPPKYLGEPREALRSQRGNNRAFGSLPYSSITNSVTLLRMPDYSIGVDLGGTNLRIAAITMAGQILEKVSLHTKGVLGPGHVIGEMCDAILQLADRYRPSGRFLGVGVGFPGIIDMETGTLRKSANLPGWSDYPVKQEIERRLGARVCLENDANVAALGEKWLGAARDVDDMAMITLGTGIGGGIVLGGKIFHGMNGMAGEFGHVTIEPDGVPCGCGNHGCAERYASATALVRMGREAIESGHAPALAQLAASGAEFSAKAIYDLAMKGDEAAQSSFQRFGRALGMLLADLVNILNLNMYVIGGGVVSAWEAFAPVMFKEMRERSIVYAATAPTDPMARAAPEASTRRQTIITRAILGSDAGLYGGARLPAL
jgi:glucokinase